MEDLDYLFLYLQSKLFYYTFPKDEKHNYEVDFLLSRGAKLWPVEVKSEEIGRASCRERV